MTLAGTPGVHHGTGHRRRRRALVFGPATLVLLAALVVEGRSVLFFHTVTPWSSPDRMHVCGRDYRRDDGVVSRSAAEETVGPARLRPVARGALWQPVYGRGQEPAGASVPCGMVVFLREGTGYRPYDLVGGP